ncbi:unnamed protein product [Urochloa humidicola]
MLGRMAAGVTERREASFDRTGTAVSPPPPKLFLADDGSGVVSGVSPPAPVEAAVMSPTSILQAAAGGPTSPPADTTAAPFFFSRHGASSSSSSSSRRCTSHRRRPAWKAAGHAGLGLAGVLNGGDAGPPAARVLLTGQSFRSPAFAGDGRSARSSEAYTHVVAVDGRGRFAVGAGGEFLRWCHGCSKDLGQGKDIFMYRGEMAFCSRECRYREMVLFGEES